MKKIARAMQSYLDGGLSIIPINQETKRPYSRLLPQAVDSDGCLLFYKEDNGALVVTTEPTKIRKGTWEPYQNRQPYQDEITRWINAGVQSIAVVGGAVSGGLEILDFDVLGYYERFAEIAGNIIDTLPRQRTGGGGIQIGYRCLQPAGNQKLAWHPDATQHSGRIIAIETRGEHGYALLPPSLHPSGRHYELLNGRFSQVPTISQEERDYLLWCAKSLCQSPKSRRELERGEVQRRERKEYTGDSVIDAYNAKYSIEETLRAFSYTKLHGGRWSRPGKEASGGVMVFPGENKSYHYSSNDPLDADTKGLHQPRSPFDFFLEYKHAGDYTRAVREAAMELGMVHKKPESEQAEPTEPEEILADEVSGLSQDEVIERNTELFFRMSLIGR